MSVILDESGMIEHVYQNPETKVGKGLCPSHIVKVWKAVNTIILRSLCTGSGVKLAKFFAVTLKIANVESHTHGHSHSMLHTAIEADAKMLKRRPYIYLAEELALKHNIHAKEHNPDFFDLPEVDLNLSNVATLCRLTRNQVELCLEEIFTAFDLALEKNDHVELPLNEIGKVVIHSGVMKTEFNHDFLSLLGFSEDIKRCFYPHPPHSESLLSFADYRGSLSSSTDESEAEDDEFEHRSSSQLEEEEDQLVKIPSSPLDMEEEEDSGESGHESIPILEESEEEKRRRSNAHRTLLERECVVRENFLVWETISKYLIRKMIEGIAVRISGLGTFTHSILPNDSTNTTFEGVASLRKSRKFPIFKICTHLKEMNSLTEDNELVQCNAPIMNLNTGIIAKESSLTHGIVEGILTETLQAFARGVITNKNIQFPFPFIGKLHVEERSVYMLFYEEFCEGLEFNFHYDPSYISSVIPGQMTPLIYHRPTPHFTSVFHYQDMKVVEENMRASTPCVYGEGESVLRNEDDCNRQKRPPHSKLVCYCCKCRRGKSKECESVENAEDSCQLHLGHSRPNELVRNACCPQSGSISFRQPDGSTFSPAALFAPAKTGNFILDRLADDKCLMQQALGRWMKRNFVNTLGREEVLKHYDRDCFKKGDFNIDEEIDGPQLPPSSRGDSIITMKESEEEEEEEEEVLLEEVASTEEASPPQSQTESHDHLNNLGSISARSNESFHNLRKVTGKDSMIIGLHQYKRDSLDVASEKRRLRQSHLVEVPSIGAEPKAKGEEKDDDDKSVHSQSGKDTTPGTSIKDEIISATTENSDRFRPSFKSSFSDNVDEDRGSSSRNVNKESIVIAKGTDETPEDDVESLYKNIAVKESSSHSPLSDHSHSLAHPYKQEDPTEEVKEQAPTAVHTSETELVNKPDKDQLSDKDSQIHLDLKEDEVIINLGLKKKKRCKPKSSVPKSKSNESFMLEQEKEIMDTIQNNLKKSDLLDFHFN